MGKDGGMEDGGMLRGQNAGFFRSGLHSSAACRLEASENPEGKRHAPAPPAETSVVVLLVSVAVLRDSRGHTWAGGNVCRSGGMKPLLTIFLECGYRTRTAGWKTPTLKRPKHVST